MAEDRSAWDLRGVLQVVDLVYAAACGEKPWQHAVAAACGVGNLDGCALSVIDQLARRRVVLARHGVTYQPEPGDLLSTDNPPPPPDVFWRDHRIGSETLATTTLCWTDWKRPDGPISWACLTFSEEPCELSCFEAYAEAERGSRCPELRRFLRQLAPHLSRAWRIGRSGRTIRQHNAAPSPAAPERASHNDPPAGLDALPEAARLRSEFGLTKAEARLALCLARGWSLATAAEAFDVKLTTIRSQLQQVFSKTGTSRQAECVAMLLSRGYGSQRALGLPTEVTKAGAAVLGRFSRL